MSTRSNGPRRGARPAAALLCIALALAAYAGFARSSFADPAAAQIREDIVLLAVPGPAASFGQSFTAARPGLHSVRLHARLEPWWSALPGSAFRFTLYDEAGATLAAGGGHLLRAGDQGVIEFRFAPQPDSQGRQYRLRFEAPPTYAGVPIWTSAGDAYPGGSAELGGQVVPYDLAFITGYHPPWFAWLMQTLTTSRQRLLLLLLLTVSMWVLGRAALMLLAVSMRDPLSDALVAVGVGAAVPALLLPSLGVLRIEINRSSLIAALALLIVAGLAARWLRGRAERPAGSSNRCAWTEWLPLLLMSALAMVSRAAQVEAMAVPAWVDGIVHQRMLGTMLAAGRVGLDAVYPKGFHATAAAVQLLTGVPLPESLLITGQWLSFACGLTLYPLARRFLRPHYALFAIGLYWFWTAFPAFLINWSRYPLLHGLALLAVTMSIVMEARRQAKRYFLLLAMLLAALALTYYGALLMALTFMAASLAIQGRRLFAHARRWLWLGAAVVPTALLLLLKLGQASGRGVMGQDTTAAFWQDGSRALEIAWMHGEAWVWLLAGIGALLAVFRRGASERLWLLWMALLALVSIAFFRAGMPVSSLLNVVIAASLPVALLAALGLRRLASWVAPRGRAWLVSASLVLAVAGAYRMSGIVDPSVVLFTRADERAMEWIRAHTSSESTFLINSFQWGDERAASDGGAWLTTLTGRRSRLFDSTRQGLGAESEVEYIYVGRAYGNLDPVLLRTLGGFAVVYAQNGVVICRIGNRHR